MTLLLQGCREANIYNEGVSIELATIRFESITEVNYNLHFIIPKERDQQVVACTNISFNLGKKREVLLDFMPVAGDTGAAECFVESVFVNGVLADVKIKREHIIIPPRFLREGMNIVEIEHIAGDMSLNRRDDLLYTLLVPDRARTLFPCFDQPDIKARYTLTLDIPQEWVCVSNGLIMGSDLIDQGEMKRYFFSMTEKIPTYLFSFAAGRFFTESQQREGRSVTIYHRESDTSKREQCSAIFDQIFYSLNWLEEYTGIIYPFMKYDAVIIPGFQYGGMEHVGATLYNASRMFLQEGATVTDHLRRASLIAHETAHMWFGDFVTMKWFNDVWTKEVFANWFASQIVSPQYPDIDHDLNFIDSYYPASYSVDRTDGANPVQQKLDNLNNAGLVYGNIIYNKAPIVMEMLVRKSGKDAFQSAIREYLNSYAYSNATWDDLITILQKYCEEDIVQWSNVWVKEKGMPHISFSYTQDSSGEINDINYNQTDPFGRGIKWDQVISSRLEQNEKGTFLLTNRDGFSYGLFDIENTEALLFSLSEESLSERERLSAMINLYENLEAERISAADFCRACIYVIGVEKEKLILNRTLQYLSQAVVKHLDAKRDANLISEIENFLWDRITSENSDSETRNYLFKGWCSLATSSNALEKLYDVWSYPSRYPKLKIGERDMINISYTLAIAFKDRRDEISESQRMRIKSKDVMDEYNYLFPSTSSDRQVRDSVFLSLSDRENRSVEPWCASALSLLNHRFVQKESLHYIRPALDLLEEIQRTGDIFFPTNWISSLLKGHNSEEAKEIVYRFISDNQDMNPLLLLKIKQNI